MNKIRKILCVLDPTVSSQPAMHRSAWLAAKTGAKLELMVCFYNEYVSGHKIFDAPSLQKTRRELLAGYEKHLENLAEPLREQGVDYAAKAVWDHPLYEGIVRHACAIDADIVMKDTHHHSALRLATLNNTDWNLIRTCPIPLWFVKPKELPADLHIIAAIDPMNERDKPAALDDEIVTISQQLANGIGADVHAFHSFDPRIALAATTANSYVPVSLPLDIIEEQVRQQHEKRFDEIVEFHNIPVDQRHLIAGLTHEELPELANNLDSMLVVMGAIARNRWKRIFVGATAERTLDHLPCDLLVIKPDWFKTPLDLALKDDVA